MTEHRGGRSQIIFCFFLVSLSFSPLEYGYKVSSLFLYFLLYLTKFAYNGLPDYSKIILVIKRVNPKSQSADFLRVFQFFSLAKQTKLISRVCLNV